MVELSEKRGGKRVMTELKGIIDFESVLFFSRSITSNYCEVITFGG